MAKLLKELHLLPTLAAANPQRFTSCGDIISICELISRMLYL